MLCRLFCSIRRELNNTIKSGDKNTQMYKWRRLVQIGFLEEILSLKDTFFLLKSKNIEKVKIK